MDAKEKPGECESCDFETADLDHYHEGPGLAEKWLCPLCAGTVTGTLVNDPGEYGHETAAILRTICYVGNAIIRAVNRPVEPPAGSR